MDSNLLGEFIKSSRTIKKLSLRDLAEASDLSYSQLSKIERGKSSPTKETLLKLSFALNVDRSEMLALGGYVDEEIQEDIITNMSLVTRTTASGVKYLDGLVDLIIADVLRESKTPEYYAKDFNRDVDNKQRLGKSAFIYALSELIAANNESLTDAETITLAKEMFAAYNLGLRRINLKKKL